jgi:hypothetical protein
VSQQGSNGWAFVSTMTTLSLPGYAARLILIALLFLDGEGPRALEQPSSSWCVCVSILGHIPFDLLNMNEGNDGPMDLARPRFCVGLEWP